MVTRNTQIKQLYLNQIVIVVSLSFRENQKFESRAEFSYFIFWPNHSLIANICLEFKAKCKSNNIDRWKLEKIGGKRQLFFRKHNTRIILYTTIFLALNIDVDNSAIQY